jgi:hypothetical protein
MSKTSKTFFSFLTEIRKNTRLRVGLWFILGLLLSYVALLLNDYQVQLQQTHQDAINRLIQLQDIANQTQWLERAPKARALRTQLDVKFWQANTQGLAQATFQKWLNTQVNQAKMEKAHVRIQSTLELSRMSNVWKITARLDASFTPDSLHKLLLAMAKYPQFIVTERLEIRNKNRVARFTLIVSAYFQGKET